MYLTSYVPPSVAAAGTTKTSRSKATEMINRFIFDLLLRYKFENTVDREVRCACAGILLPYSYIDCGVHYPHIVIKGGSEVHSLSLLQRRVLNCRTSRQPRSTG